MAKKSGKKPTYEATVRIEDAAARSRQLRLLEIKRRASASAKANQEAWDSLKGSDLLSELTAWLR